MEQMDHVEGAAPAERLDTTLVKGLRILETLALSNEPQGVSS